jgi:sugar transferase (PEP-CTERM/EpsH1 system associated)
MRILFLAHRLPYRPDRGDRIRAYYLLRELARFASVSLFSLVHDDEEEAAAARMPFVSAVGVSRVRPLWNRVIGTTRLLTSRPLTHSLLDARGAIAEIDRLCRAAPPDVVLAYCSGMARFALMPPLEALPFVLDMVDVDSAKWQLLSTRSRWPLRWIYRREARTLSRFEAHATRRAAATLVVSERERALLRQLAPLARIDVVGNGVDLTDFAPPGPPAATDTVVFTGVLDYGPNEQGVRWFADRVWPLVRAARPQARWLVVGARPPAPLRRLPARDASIEVTGRVEAVPPYLWQSAVAVAPLHVARGQQNKVLEAIAAGVPVVATTAVVEGLPAHVRSGCLTADREGDFDACVVDLLRRAPHDRRALAARVDLTELSWSARLRPLEEILRAACTRSSITLGK